MTAWLAERVGTALLHLASRLLRYAERRYGPPVSPPPPASSELPPRVEVIVEHLIGTNREEPETPRTLAAPGQYQGRRVRGIPADTNRVVTRR